MDTLSLAPAPSYLEGAVRHGLTCGPLVMRYNAGVTQRTKYTIGIAVFAIAFAGAGLAFQERPWFVAVTALAAIVEWIVVARIMRQEREQKRADAGLCFHCEYNLTGNTSGICPECGHKIKPDHFAPLSDPKKSD